MRRRELLQAFLGLPAAVAACRHGQAPRPALPPGELVSRREVLGHELRDRTAIEPPPDRWEDIPVVIIGAGVAGLAAAWRLARAGFERFVVLELDPVAGGTSRSGSSPSGAHPWGAHYITAPMLHNRALIALLGEMSILDGTDADGEPVIGEQYLCRDPDERLFYRGRWYGELYLAAGASAADRAERAAFDATIGRLAGLTDGRGRRAFALPSAMSSDDAELIALDRITMAEWMAQNRFTSERLRWYVDYACRDDYGMRMEDTSAWAGLFYFAARLRHARAEYQPVVTWPEGNGRLIAHLAGAARARLRLGWAAAEIRHSPRPEHGHDQPGSPLEIVALAAGDGQNRQARAAAGIRAQNIIFAAPHFLTRYLIRDYRDVPPAHVGEFDHGAWMVANLHLRDRPLGAAPAWDNVIHDSPSLGYVVSTHQRGLDHGPTVITYYYPLLDPDSRAGRRALLEAGRADWAEVVLSDLERPHHDIRQLTDRIDIMRWGHAMIRPRPGFIWGGARQAATQPYRGIHFAHSDLSGIALFEEAFDHGLRAAEEVLASRGIAMTSMR